MTKFGMIATASLFGSLLLNLTLPILAQDCTLLPGQPVLGTNSNVYATTTWDPDGSGPAPEILIAAGEFTAAGDVRCNYIARWNNSVWRPLGSGMNDNVHGLAVFDGELIAGGEFTVVEGQPSAYWAHWLCTAPARCAGDMNCDGLLNNFDIDPFVLVLTEPELYSQLYPDCDIRNGDVNEDGLLNNFDIDAFVEHLGQPCP